MLNHTIDGSAAPNTIVVSYLKFPKNSDAIKKKVFYSDVLYSYVCHIPYCFSCVDIMKLVIKDESWKDKLCTGKVNRQFYYTSLISIFI